MEIIKEIKHMLTIGLLLMFCSVFLYIVQILIFHDLHETFFLLFQEIAFIPIEVIIVTFILEKLLDKREKEERFKKMHIVVSAFFSEVGVPLIEQLSFFNTNFKALCNKFDSHECLSARNKNKMTKCINEFDYIIDSRLSDLEELRSFLYTKKAYILRMFENPNLLEHDYFTDMLWSIYHIFDELDNRDDLSKLSSEDYGHISNDIKRAYQLVIKEWLIYLNHLESEYPYLYSMAVRKSPLIDKQVMDDEQEIA